VERELLPPALESSRKVEPQSPPPEEEEEEGRPASAAAQMSATEGVRMLASWPSGLTQLTGQGRPFMLAERDGGKGAPAGAKSSRCVELDRVADRRAAEGGWEELSPAASPASAVRAGEHNGRRGELQRTAVTLGTVAAGGGEERELEEELGGEEAEVPAMDCSREEQFKASAGAARAELGLPVGTGEERLAAERAAAPEQPPMQ
jgi:hypothetical protein